MSSIHGTCEMAEMHSDKTSPSCLPIKNLEDLLSWEKSQISWNVNVEAKAQCADYVYKGTFENDIRYYKPSCPRTLLCHDFKGGYLEDRFVHGSADVLDPYIFTNWIHVDTFVYFSHHFVTIPPVGWINAAHKHGVQILGTFITEWTDGEKMWKELFDNDLKMNMIIRKLVDICKHFKFDGYLINIENIVPGKDIDKMKRFVKILTQSIHQEIQDSTIIWYDSVISPSGELKWQNELNEYNKDFFQNCDGIFLNYNWTEETLKTTLKNAGVRKYDVYVGVDVFGRGCFGGGGFNSDLAMEKIRQYNMSAAIFAHAWTHETKTDAENFHEREVLFWSKLRPYLYINVLAIDSCFYTCFNNGYGTSTFLNGSKVRDAVQYNLSEQSLQVFSTSSFEYEDGFSGLGCIKLKPLTDNKYHVLFLNQIKLDKFKVKIATKCSASYDYSFLIFFEYHQQRQRCHKFILRKDEKIINELCADCSTTVYESHGDRDTHRKRRRKDLQVLGSQCSWDVKTFSVESVYSGFITEVGIDFTTEADVELLLGELKIYDDK